MLGCRGLKSCGEGVSLKQAPVLVINEDAWFLM